MFNTVYLRLATRSIMSDMHFFRDRNEVAAINAYYKMGKNRLSGWKYEYHRLAVGDGKPVHSRQHGQTDGGFTRRTGNNRDYLCSCCQRGMCGWTVQRYMSRAVGSSFRFDKQDIKIKDNLISFDKYNIYASGTNPFCNRRDDRSHNPSR